MGNVATLAQNGTEVNRVGADQGEELPESAPTVMNWCGCQAPSAPPCAPPIEATEQPATRTADVKAAEPPKAVKVVERDKRWDNEVFAWKWWYAAQGRFQDSDGRAAATLKVKVTGFSVVDWHYESVERADQDGCDTSTVYVAHPVLCTVEYELFLDSQGGKSQVIDAGTQCFNQIVKKPPQKLGPSFDRKFECEIFEVMVKSTSKNRIDATVQTKGSFSAALALAIAYALANPMHPAELMNWMNERALTKDDVRRQGHYDDAETNPYAHLNLHFLPPEKDPSEYTADEKRKVEENKHKLELYHEQQAEMSRVN